MEECPATGILDIVSRCCETKPVLPSFNFDVLLVCARKFHFDGVVFLVVIQECIRCDKDAFFFSQSYHRMELLLND